MAELLIAALTYQIRIDREVLALYNVINKSISILLSIIYDTVPGDIEWVRVRAEYLSQSG